jgi:hypothetical protein
MSQGGAQSWSQEHIWGGMCGQLGQGRAGARLSVQANNELFRQNGGSS